MDTRQERLSRLDSALLDKRQICSSEGVLCAFPSALKSPFMNVDMMHPEASASFMQTVQGMQYQGKSKQEAVNMAATSTKGRIQVQATLSAVKEMAGWTLYACLFCMIFVVVLPYPKRKLLT